MLHLSQLTKSLAFIVSVLAISLSLSYFVLAWTEPTVAPPSGNAATPINAGITNQIKSGNLQVNALGVQGTGNVLLVPNGNVGIGTTAPGQRLTVAGTIESTSGGFKFPDGSIQVSAASGGGGQYFGDGGDGDVTLSSSTTLTRNMNYDNLVINPGVTIYPDGYLISVKNTLTNNGVISRTGNNGGGCGTSASGLPSRYTGGSYSGGIGGVSGSLGTGGVGLGGAAGGGGGPLCCPGAGGGNIAKLYSSPSLLVVSKLLQELGGAGGGGSGSGACGCGGGSGGGNLGIFVKNIINNGTITAKGGNGGSCTTGGGGGGGGTIVLVYSSKSGSGIFDVSGGDGGTGSSCCNGTSGVSGSVYYIPVF